MFVALIVRKICLKLNRHRLGSSGSGFTVWAASKLNPQHLGVTGYCPQQVYHLPKVLMPFPGGIAIGPLHLCYLEVMQAHWGPAHVTPRYCGVDQAQLNLELKEFGDCWGGGHGLSL